MIGIVNTDENLLTEISERLHVALNSSEGLRYVAQQYGEPMKHPAQELFALVVLPKTDYNSVIMDTLTDQEIAMIQTLGNDWFVS